MRPDLHVLEAEHRGERDGRGPESLGRRIRGVILVSGGWGHVPCRAAAQMGLERGHPEPHQSHLWLLHTHHFS